MGPDAYEPRPRVLAVTGAGCAGMVGWKRTGKLLRERRLLPAGPLSRRRPGSDRVVLAIGDDAIASALLGAVHRFVRLVENDVEIAAILGIACDAEAYGDVGVAGTHIQARDFDCFADAFRHFHRALVAGFRQQHDEFVPAEPCHDVRAAQLFAYAAHQMLQEP